MRSFALILMLAASLAATPQRGTNQDPPQEPPVYDQAPKTEEPKPPPPAPWFDYIHWNEPKTFVKVGLLVGSALVVVRVVREMKWR